MHTSLLGTFHSTTNSPMFRHIQRKAVALGVAGCLSLHTTISQSQEAAHNKPITSLRTVDKSLVDLTGYHRIDHMIQKLSAGEVAKNAVHGTLLGDSLIEVYEIYYNKDKGELLSLIHVGTELNGHHQVLHGGITATLFDNSFGWLYVATKLPQSFTANLSVNYRAKVPEDSTLVLRARVKEVQGRKMFFEASMHDTSGKLVADSTSLFIAARAAGAASSDALPGSAATTK